jgi:hypothetical protein
MRVYAVLMGMVLTAGSAYLAQVAVGAAGFERLTVPSPSPSPSSSGDGAVARELWYGGVLDPVTIEAGRAPPVSTYARGAPWTPSSELAVNQEAVECPRHARSKRHALTAADSRASLGSMM